LQTLGKTLRKRWQNARSVAHCLHPTDVALIGGQPMPCI
jgi:hypothetical protein